MNQAIYSLVVLEATAAVASQWRHRYVISRGFWLVKQAMAILFIDVSVKEVDILELESIGIRDSSKRERKEKKRRMEEFSKVNISMWILDHQIFYGFQLPPPKKKLGGGKWREV